MRVAIFIAPLLVLGGVTAHAYPSEYDTFDNGLSNLYRRGYVLSKLPNPAAVAAAKAAWEKAQKSKETGYRIATGVAIGQNLPHSPTSVSNSHKEINAEKDSHLIADSAPPGHGNDKEDKKGHDEGHKKAHKERGLLTPEEEHYFLVARHAEALADLEELYYY
ncbi:hypothetical protein MMC15_006491 [Xylographa vitiligo]|nr:hypothetical protein [Xylographa vitiligo]